MVVLTGKHVASRRSADGSTVDAYPSNPIGAARMCRPRPSGVPHVCHRQSPTVLTHGESRTIKTATELATPRFHELPRLSSKQLVTADQGAGLGCVRSFVHEVLTKQHSVSRSTQLTSFRTYRPFRDLPFRDLAISYSGEGT